MGLVWRRFWICILSVLDLALVGVVIFGFVVVLIPVFVVIVRGGLVVGLGAGWGFSSSGILCGILFGVWGL